MTKPDTPYQITRIAHGETLKKNDLNFQQVAERFAFPDQSAFGQYFKRHTGLSLTEFRKNQQ